jgi:flavodoxin
MKALVVYSSQTGNTREMAETICGALPDGTLMTTLEEAPEPSEYDFVAVGFWLQAGKPNPASAVFLERLKNHPGVFLFATHGARPGSDHAKAALDHARDLARGATIVGTFSCFGEVNPKALKKAKSKPQPPAWLADAPHAIGHPDSEDRKNLIAAIKAALG